MDIKVIPNYCGIFKIHRKSTENSLNYDVVLTMFFLPIARKACVILLHFLHGISVLLFLIFYELEYQMFKCPRTFRIM